MLLSSAIFAVDINNDDEKAIEVTIEPYLEYYDNDGGKGCLIK